MRTIGELQESGVKAAEVLCPACARLFKVDFVMMFRDDRTAYADIARHRSFRCPSCGSTRGAPLLRVEDISPEAFVA